jgi:hypothetical protein
MEAMVIHTNFDPTLAKVIALKNLGVIYILEAEWNPRVYSILAKELIESTSACEHKVECRREHQYEARYQAHLTNNLNVRYNRPVLDT